jgi:hypothetical protein
MFNPFNNPNDFDQVAETLLACGLLLAIFIIGGLT